MADWNIEGGKIKGETGEGAGGQQMVQRSSWSNSFFGWVFYMYPDNYEPAIRAHCTYRSIGGLTAEKLHWW